MRVPVSEPDIGPTEMAYAAEALESGWVSGRGPFVRRLEADFAQYCGAAHAVTTTNGTTALHLALMSLGVGPGDEVAVPAFSYVAAANAVRYVGAEPVLVEVEEETWGMAPDALEESMSSRTRCIIAVHNYGIPCQMGELRRIADAYGVPLVEDAAEALGARVGERMAGSWGDVATFSFYGNKIITGGEGGILVSPWPKVAERARYLANQAMDENRRYYFPEVGFNYRMTNVTAAIILAQLERLPDLLELREGIWRRYLSRLMGVAELSVPPSPTGSTISPWLFGVVLGRTGHDFSRNRVASRLEDEGIETRPFFFPLHRLPAFSSCRRSPNLSVTEWLAGCGLSLPTFPRLSLEQQDFVCDRLLSVLES